MKKFKKTIKENVMLRKLVTELEDVQKQIEIQQDKQKAAEEIYMTDKKILKEYYAKIADTASAADATELKNLQTSIQDLEKSMSIQLKMGTVLRDTVSVLHERVKEHKSMIGKLLKLIVAHYKKYLEVNNAAELLDAFLKLNNDFAVAVDTLFQGHGLRLLDVNEKRISFRGNFNFISYLFQAGERVEHHMVRNTPELHAQHDEKELNKLSRILNNT